MTASPNCLITASMSTVSIDQAMRLALEHFHASRLADAEGILRQILSVVPDHADALHLLGLVGHLVGRNDVAMECIRKAVHKNPNSHLYHSNLGEIFRLSGQIENAIAACRTAIQLKPNYAEAH